MSRAIRPTEDARRVRRRRARAGVSRIPTRADSRGFAAVRGAGALGELEQGAVGVEEEEDAMQAALDRQVQRLGDEGDVVGTQVLGRGLDVGDAQADAGEAEVGGLALWRRRLAV